MRRTVLVALFLSAGCSGGRELQLVQALPGPCATTSGSVNELRVRGLGDFQPAASDVASTSNSSGSSLALALPRGTRVVSLEGLGTSTGLFGRTAPLELPAVWSEAHVVSVTYGPPSTFCDTATMSYARTSHRATLLSDGSVLLSGGVDREGHAVVPLERYLPAGDASSPVARFELADPGGPTLDERSVLGHATVLLPDGRVLVAGGAPAQDGSGHAIAYEGAALLDSTGKLDGVPKLLGGGPRAYHASLVLPGGNVLLTGGCSEVTASGCETGQTLDTAVLYDPSTDTFANAPTLATARAGHSAILRSDGLVLLVGGRADDGSALQPELYDPTETRGTILNGPVGAAVGLDSGLVIGLNDTAGPSARTSAWSGRDDAPVVLPQLPSERTGGTLTALEDGSVLFAGGWNGSVLADTNVVLTGDTQSAALGISGFAAHEHTATRLLDGTVLLTGGSDASGSASTHAAVFLRSLRGPFDTPATFDFGTGIALSPSRADHAAMVDGALVVTADAQAGSALVDFALVSGPTLAGPSSTGFQVSVLVGRGASGVPAILFGTPTANRYVAVLLKPGAAPSVLVVAPGRDAGLVDVAAQSGCTTSALTDAELPTDGFGAFTVSARSGAVELRAGTRRVLRCSGKGWPQRGAIGIGAQSGTARFDNLAVVR